MTSAHTGPATGRSLEADCGAGHGWEPPDSGRFCRHRPEHSRFECDCGPLPPATMMDQPLTPGLGGARGHAHTAPHNTCTIQTQHRRGYPPRGPAWKSGVQNPSVGVSRGHLPGSTVGVCEPRLRRELALGPRSFIPKTLKIQHISKEAFSSQWSHVPDASSNLPAL